MGVPTAWRNGAKAEIVVSRGDTAVTAERTDTAARATTYARDLHRDRERRLGERQCDLAGRAGRVLFLRDVDGGYRRVTPATPVRHV